MTNRESACNSIPGPAIAKTVTFALLHFGVAFTVTYALTGSMAVATGVGLIEPLVNTIVFYFHERAWGRYQPAHSLPLPLRTACCAIVRAR
jgi:uncharacterized membrane protein